MMSQDMIADVKGALAGYREALKNGMGIKGKRDVLTNMLMNYADAMVESAEYTERLVEEMAKLATENAALKRKAKPEELAEEMAKLATENAALKRKVKPAKEERADDSAKE